MEGAGSSNCTGNCEGVFEGTDWKEQVAATVQGIKEYSCLIASYEGILEEETFCLAKLKFSISSIQTVRDSLVATCVFGHVDVMVQMTCLHFTRQCFLLKFSVICQISFFFFNFA